MELLDAPVEQSFDAATEIAATEIDGVAIIRWPHGFDSRGRARAHRRSAACCSSRPMPGRPPKLIRSASGYGCRPTNAICNSASSSCAARERGPSDRRRSRRAVARRYLGCALADRGAPRVGTRRASRSRDLPSPAREDRLARRRAEEPAPSTAGSRSCGPVLRRSACAFTPCAARATSPRSSPARRSSSAFSECTRRMQSCAVRVTTEEINRCCDGSRLPAWY